MSVFLVSNIWAAVLLALIVYLTSICVYRRFFHPLAHVPGPFLAAVTTFYQSFFNCRFYLEIGRLHQRYGPIVRITPNEIHLADAENYERIYYMGSKYAKARIFYNALCVPHSTFGTPGNELHKIKRAAMKPMFSRQKVLELEAVVQQKAERVCEPERNGAEVGVPVDLHHFFRAVPRLLLGWRRMQMECVRQIEGVKQKKGESKDVGRQTIFTTLLDDEHKPDGYRIPTTWELKDEAYSVLVAAADTTGNAMTVAASHVLNNLETYRKLTAELEAHFLDHTDTLSFLALEKLPYLTAVIKEALRLSFGVIGRLPRIVPSSGATFSSHFLPPGTTVSMSSWLMHRDTCVFPNPMTDSPNRWLVSPEQKHRLDRNMIPFGRGTRQCIGMPLTYCELYVTLGTVFRRFPQGMRVWRTKAEVMRDYEDFFSSYHPNGRKEEWFGAYVEKS